MSKVTLRQLEYKCRCLNRSILALAPFGIQVERVMLGEVGLYRQSRSVASDRRLLFSGSVRDITVYLTAFEEFYTEWKGGDPVGSLAAHP